MPSFTFVGDEPLPLPCSFTISDKAKHAFSKANEAKDSSNTQTIASLVTAIPRLVQFRLHYQKPGSLGVSIRCGAQFCIVIAKANPTSQFKVNDAIISCNGCRYENMTKLEGGIIAWMDFLKTSGEKCFIVRRGGKVAPLKDIGNTQICASGRACSAHSSNNELSLAQVSLHWKTGKGCHQTSQCKDAISSCLFNGMSAGDIARYVVRSLNKDDQATERQRVRDCAYNLLKAAGRAAPAATATKLTDVEDLLPLGIPLQQNGVIYTKRRKLLSKAAANIHEKLGSNGTGRINLEATEDVGTQAEMDQDQDQAKHRSVDMVVSGTIDILERASDTAIITPSNSMEEVDTTESNR